MRIETDNGEERGVCEQCGSYVDPDVLCVVSFDEPTRTNTVRYDTDEWSYQNGYMDPVIEQTDWLSIARESGYVDHDGQIHREHPMRKALRDECNHWIGSVLTAEVISIEADVSQDGVIEWCADCRTEAEQTAQEHRSRIEGT